MLRIMIGGLVVTLFMSSCSMPLQLHTKFINKKAINTPADEDALLSQQQEAFSAYSQSSYRKNVLHTEQSYEETLEVELPKTNPTATLNTLTIPTEIQLKYASLLNILPHTLTNIRLLEVIDDWYGTRYRYGGTTKSGIDCSAFVREVYKSVFNIELPRTAREQYRAANPIRTSELKEGDLLFFNTTGGISHVGMYLSNNKFVHASRGRGVIVSDLDESYYAARYLGARRIQTDSSYYAAN